MKSFLQRMLFRGCFIYVIWVRWTWISICNACIYYESSHKIAQHLLKKESVLFQSYLMFCVIVWAHCYCILLFKKKKENVCLSFNSIHLYNILFSLICKYFHFIKLHPINCEIFEFIFIFIFTFTLKCIMAWNVMTKQLIRKIPNWVWIEYKHVSEIYVWCM